MVNRVYIRKITMISGIVLLWYYIRIKTSDVDVRITRKLLDAFMRTV